MILVGTGHRPNKLGGYSGAAHLKLVSLAKDYLSRERDNVTEVISGMALGWDQALAEACCELGVPWTAAVPCLNQEKMWPPESKEKYNRLLWGARRVVNVTNREYAWDCMQLRNEWMVKNCDAVLALWDGSPGGTGNCLRYAREQGKEIINLWPDYLAK